jgi:hypothetical protein
MIVSSSAGEEDDESNWAEDAVGAGRGLSVDTIPVGDGGTGRGVDMIGLTTKCEDELPAVVVCSELLVATVSEDEGTQVESCDRGDTVELRGDSKPGKTSSPLGR